MLVKPLLRGGLGKLEEHCHIFWRRMVDMQASRHANWLVSAKGEHFGNLDCSIDILVAGKAYLRNIASQTVGVGFVAGNRNGYATHMGRSSTSEEGADALPFGFGNLKANLKRRFAKFDDFH